MKLIYSILFVLVIIFSCQREVDEKLESSKIDPANSSQVSKYIKVWHGIRTQGTMPAPNNNPNGPVLDNSSNNKTLKAIAGRYVIIFPEILSGNPAGYYLKVNGASEYFKIEYSKPRITERRPVKRLNNPNATLKIDTVNVLDSAIVIIIPPNIQPGTFCISYCAYDSSGNNSNIITNCITIMQSGGDTYTDFLTGVWRFDAERSDSSVAWILMDYTPMINIDTLFCNPDPAVGYYFDDYCYVGTCNSFYDTIYHYQVLKDDLSFTTAGGLRYEYKDVDKYIVDHNTVCGNAPMEDYGVVDLLEGAWSYVAAGNRLILIFDLSQYGYPDPAVYEFKLIKETNTRIILIDYRDGYQFRLTKI